MHLDDTQRLLDEVNRAIGKATPLYVQGGGTKAFYGRQPSGEVLSTASHGGIVDYEPTELVLTARSGTLLSEVESVLSQHGQMLPFEPPHFGEMATLGGTIASGLSGPRRPYTGAARDFVLGVRMINGLGRDLRFGGRVMKNVAGYDISRLMVGSLGTLGLLLEVSLKVLPQPRSERTLVLAADTSTALRMQGDWSTKASPISATCHVDGRLFVRLSGSEKGVAAAAKRLGGETYEHGHRFWRDVREQQHRFFHGDTDLWRVSVPAATPPLDLAGACLMEWNGAQRWLKCDVHAQDMRRTAARAGGHATLFRGSDRSEVFQPLGDGLLKLHSNVKNAFDPSGVFNRGRMYAGI